jgi:ABC-2 type transport system permease protein
MSLLNVVAVPAAVVLFAGSFSGSATPSGGVLSAAGAAAVVTSLTAFALLLVVYFNLVIALVARREELVLKQFRTGELSDAEILLGAAAPAVAIAWTQILVGVVGAAVALHLHRPSNPGLILVAVVLGTAVFALLAMVSTVITGSTELAQVTTLPGYLLPFVLSGLVIPLHALPGPLPQLAQLAPLTPVVDLLRLGLTGTDPAGTQLGTAASFGAAIVPVLVLIGWVIAAEWATRRWFRWEPRR